MYMNYNFIDKDPVCDELRTVIQDSPYAHNLKALAADSGVSYGTINRMIYGDTRNPRNSTVEALFRTCGHERHPVRVENHQRTPITSIRSRFIKGRRS